MPAPPANSKPSNSSVVITNVQQTGTIFLTATGTVNGGKPLVCRLLARQISGLTAQQAQTLIAKKLIQVSKLPVGKAAAPPLSPALNSLTGTVQVD